MTAAVRIRRADSDPRTALALAEVLVDCVEGGASVGFMSPLSIDRAVGYWEDVLASAARGERVVLVAEQPQTDRILGTAQLLVAMPENQPHRAEVAKVLVHRSARRQGVGEALMDAIEAEARAADRTVLVLDTASADAERLYQRRGWRLVGTIADYALLPDGRLCATVIYDRHLA